MAADSEKDTSRTVVKTYVPAYQREEWDDHANDLDMSRSEFVKAMVQAGRRGFDESATSPPEQRPETTGEEADIAEPAVGGESIESAVLSALSADSYLTWDELLDAVSDDIENQLEETLQNLQADDRVRYSGRHGGYTLE
jgi:hypothetical protein